LRLNYRTGRWQGWSGFAEYDYVLHVLSDFDSGAGKNNADIHLLNAKIALSSDWSLTPYYYYIFWIMFTASY
jgi:hypothetical protein